MLLSETLHTGYLELVPWIVFFPVIGLLLNILFGRRWGEKGVAITAVSAAALSFVVAVLQFITLRAGHGEALTYRLTDWLHIGSFEIPWEFRVDTLSVTMMLVVAGVGTLIHLYAVGYMHFDVQYKGDPKAYARFFVYLNLFIAMMMILVSGNSYLMLFVGWEGVGLCSFLLIGFWFNKNPNGQDGTENAYAAKKAFIANRVGDFGFLMAMFLTFWNFGTLSFTELFPMISHHPPQESLIWWITGFMLLGVTGKSAQIPLYVWLPDAMAGPTPVSALIHAATMVTAGVYLITRSAPIFNAVEGVHVMVALVGAITALFAATIAVGQYDIKKVLAYSTVSQLGFMVAAVGMGAYVAGMFHLVTHAFFKALLFLGSGSVILAVERGHHPLAETGDLPEGEAHGHDEHHGEHDDHSEVFDPQDMRNMGGLRKRIPWTFWTYMMGTLALSGIPIWAGFWSKDEILLDASHFEGTAAVYWLLVIAAAFTAFYMGRQIWLVFFGKPRHHAAEEAKESPWTIIVPLVALAVLATLGGFMNWPFEGGHQFGHWLGYTLEASTGHELHVPEFSFGVAGQSTLIAVAAIFISWLIYGRKPLEAGQEDPLTKLGILFKGMNAKWWVDEIYQTLILTPYEKLAKFFSQTIDWDFWHDWFHEKGIRDNFKRLARILADPIDMGVVDGVSRRLAQGVQWSAGRLSKLQTGFVRNYALAVFVGVVAILGYLIVR